MSKKRRHRTTKNTVKNPVTRIRIIGVEFDTFSFELATDFFTQKEFDVLFDEWYDSPLTKQWTAQTLIAYIKAKEPRRICLLREDYERLTAGKGEHATEEEWLAEQN